MSMSTHIYAIKSPDQTWNEMKDIWDLCLKNNIPIPSKVGAYFGYNTPNKHGVKINITKEEEIVETYSEEGASGFIVHLDKLPHDITMLKFKNSW
jgi:hypothetical protein